MNNTNKVSIIIPVYNEEKNISILIDEIDKSCNFLAEYEIIIIDDCSDDNTINVIKLKKKPNLKVIKNKQNFGQSYSIYRGVENATFDTIITLDGDLQNDPCDINNICQIYFTNKDIKLVSGIRNKRKDSALKIISSKIANRVRSFILKDNCPDTGCSLKVFDKNVFLQIPYFDGLHRFIPAFFVGMNFNVKYVNVNHRYRKYGFSKYSTLSRMFKGIYDIYRVKKLINKINND